MSTISVPDNKGVSIIELGGEFVGTIKPKGQGYTSVAHDGVKNNNIQPSNLTIKSLVEHFRGE